MGGDIFIVPEGKTKAEFLEDVCSAGKLGDKCYIDGYVMSDRYLYAIVVKPDGSINPVRPCSLSTKVFW